MIKNTNSVNCAKIVFSQKYRDVKNEVFGEKKRKKQMEKSKKKQTIKIVFLRWLSKNEKMKKLIF